MPVGSPYPDFELPNEDVWGFLFERKDRPFPDDKVIFTDPYAHKSYTYKQVRDGAIEFGKGLCSVLEWKKNDVLALFTPNSIDTPIVMWGCQWAGGVVTPANPGYTVDEFVHQLRDAGAKAIVTQVPFLKTAVEAAKVVGISEERIILMGNEKDPTYRFKHFTSIRNLSGTSRFRRVKRANPVKELAYLPYSSGTTGKPKGVMLSHTNITSNITMQKMGDGMHLSWESDKLIACLPFFHIYGLTCLVHQAFYSGYELVVMPKFDIDDFCKIIQDYRITFAYLVPPIILRLAKDPVVSKYDLSTIRMINSGAAPLTKELVEAFYKRHKVPVKQGYGLSETSPTTHSQTWDSWRTNIGSVGLLLSNQTAKYMDAEEKELAVGEVGELWLKGPNIFLGYLNNIEATRNCLTEDGWFRTGDVGYQAKDGNFYITDRIKELIKYKGFQVPPAELEGLLVTHPKILDVAVTAIFDDAQQTELPRAYVVLNPGESKSPATAAEIADWLAKKVAHHKRLRGGVNFIDEIPKSASGKILRRMLKAEAAKEVQIKAKL